ncbi:hypothetical protein ACFQYP_65630, partial [Nonomuraea antimicrobica]
PLAGSGKQAVALRVLPGLVDGLLAAHVAARRAAGDTWEHIGQVLEMHPDTVRRRFGQQQADTERREDLGDARLADPAGTSRPATVPDITTTSSPTSPRKQPIEEPAAGDGGSEVTPVDDQTGTETGTETGTDRPRDLRTVDRLGPDWATENDVLWWRRETRAGSVSPAWPGSGWTARNAQHTPITTGAGKRGAYSSRIKALTAVAADFEARRRAQTAHADVALEGAPEGWRLTQTQADMDRHRWNVVTPTGDVAGTVSKAGWHRQAWKPPQATRPTGTTTRSRSSRSGTNLAAAAPMDAGAPGTRPRWRSRAGTPGLNRGRSELTERLVLSDRASKEPVVDQGPAYRHAHDGPHTDDSPLPVDPVDIAVDACVLLANHLDLLAHQIRERVLNDHDRVRLAAAATRVEKALATITVAAVPSACAATLPPLHEEEPVGPVTMRIVTWTRPDYRQEDGRWVATGTQSQRRIHVSLDGQHTVCGSQIPDHATTEATTADWHLHTNCYNCAYRLWPEHAPAGYAAHQQPRLPLRRTSTTWEQLDAASRRTGPGAL